MAGSLRYTIAGRAEKNSLRSNRFSAFFVRRSLRSGSVTRGRTGKPKAFTNHSLSIFAFRVPQTANH
jgi:hypothetical protein